MRRAPHRDKAERGIIDALEAVGASVEQLDGEDIPDLLVGFRGENHLLEVKSPAELVTGKDRRKDGTPQVRRQAAGELSKGQRTWHQTWRGKAPSLVRTPEEALRAIGAIR
jgi:hypothetical protein